jgi:hypothetical protein
LKSGTWPLGKDSLKPTCILIERLKKYKLVMDKKILSPMVSAKETDSSYST